MNQRRPERAAPRLVRLLEITALLVITLWGLTLRLEGWGEYWVNEDEGLYWSIATATPEEAATEIAQNAHPPLYGYLLRVLRALGADIEGLRLLSLIAGVLSIPIIGWLARLWAGPWAGGIAALLVACSPGSIQLSQVIRQYTLVVLLLSLALAFLSADWRAHRPWRIALFSLFLGLAMLVHYSAWVVAGGAGLFVLVQIATDRSSRRRRIARALALLPPLGLAIFMYLTHVRGLHGSELQAYATDDWLRSFYGFGRLFRNLTGSAHYALGRPVADLAIAMALAAPLLATWRQRRWHPAWVVVLSIAVAAMLSVLDLYPLGRTRHAVQLLPLYAAATGAGLALLTRSRWTWPLFLVGLVIVARPLVSVVREGPEAQMKRILPERVIEREWAEQVREALTRQVAPGDLVVMDLKTRELVLPLLADRTELEMLPVAGDGVAAFEAESKSFVLTMRWKLEEPEQVVSLLERLAAQRDERWKPTADRSVWLLQGGYLPIVARSLPGEAYDPVLMDGVGGGSDVFSLVRLDPEVLVEKGSR